MICIDEIRHNIESASRLIQQQVSKTLAHRQSNRSLSIGFNGHGKFRSTHQTPGKTGVMLREDQSDGLPAAEPGGEPSYLVGVGVNHIGSVPLMSQTIQYPPPDNIPKGQIDTANMAFRNKNNDFPELTRPFLPLSQHDVPFVENPPPRIG